jgi:hypothetical protein
LSTRPRERTSISTRVSVHVMMEVFQLLDNNPLLGHDRVKMALDSLGYRYGHTTVWQMVALYKEAHPHPTPSPHTPRAEERPLPTTAPHQAWFIDVRYLVKIEGHWLYSILLFDGYSRALVGAGCFDRQNLSRIVQVCRQAIARWGAPEAVVSDNTGVFLALHPCLQQLGIRWSPIARGHPWQNLAEGGLAIQRRMLDAYVTGGTDRATVYRQPAQFVQDYQFWGHWAHKRTDAQRRIDDLSAEVILGNARGRDIEPARLRRIFRLRQQTRQVRQQGQMRRHHFGLYIDPGLWGHTVDVLMYDDAVRIEPAEQLLVSYPCIYDTRQRWLTAVDGTGRQQYHRVQTVQRMLWTLELVRTVWCMPRYRRASSRRGALYAPQVGLFESFAS